MKLSHLEQKMLMNIQLGVICADMVDFCRPGHKLSFMFHVPFRPVSWLAFQKLLNKTPLQLAVEYGHSNTV